MSEVSVREERSIFHFPFSICHLSFGANPVIHRIVGQELANDK
jgi:hypothetical protein